VSADERRPAEATPVEHEVRELRALLTSIHEDALYQNQCPWCDGDPSDEHEVLTDEDGDKHPCFGERVYAAIKDQRRLEGAWNTSGEKP
jgi:O-succinylbenzoate synthase